MLCSHAYTVCAYSFRAESTAMAKNKVQYQKGLSVNGFLEKYGTEELCEKALFKWRYPQGFVCKNCSNTTGDERSG